MKLKNKKTGEIVEGTDILALMATGDDLSLPIYHSLAELNKDWEDYEEPERKHWYMTSWGEVWQYGDESLHEKWRILLGNDFETKEEAEKAVEKLKAWKRLKDKGFRFNGGDDACISYRLDPAKWNDKLENDFDLLFGGEE